VGQVATITTCPDLPRVRKDKTLDFGRYTFLAKDPTKYFDHNWSVVLW
jgi:hypothetical protein